MKKLTFHLEISIKGVHVLNGFVNDALFEE